MKANLKKKYENDEFIVKRFYLSMDKAFEGEICTDLTDHLSQKIASKLRREKLVFN